MNVVRQYIKRPWAGTGVKYYEDDILVGSLETVVEWCNVAKRIYDNPDTVYFPMPISDTVPPIEDEDGNPV